MVEEKWNGIQKTRGRDPWGLCTGAWWAHPPSVLDYLNKLNFTLSLSLSDAIKLLHSAFNDAFVLAALY